MIDRRKCVVSALLIGGVAGGRAWAGTDVTYCAESGNHTIDFADLLAVLSDWGPCAPDVFCPADVDGSGTVDFADLLIVLSTWNTPCIENGAFPEAWISGGPACGAEPAIQIHRYNENMYILRQSLCTNFEAPFMYLLFGEDKVLMQDTGAGGGIPIAATVNGIIDDWLAEHEKESIQLIVSHSHAHSDHVAGDSQFAGQPDTTVVGLLTSSVQAFFGISDWPDEIVEYDLGGGRIVDVIPIPGHQSAHIALYDRYTGLLFTGDTLYPGRLYISTFSLYLASIQRMVDFTERLPLHWVLGTHIEMSTTPTVDFPLGSTYHPNEHPLQLTRDHLLELNLAVIDMQDDPFIDEHDDFIVWPLGVGPGAGPGALSDPDGCGRPGH